MTRMAGFSSAAVKASTTPPYMVRVRAFYLSGRLKRISMVPLAVAATSSSLMRSFPVCVDHVRAIKARRRVARVSNSEHFRRMTPIRRAVSSANSPIATLLGRGYGMNFTARSHRSTRLPPPHAVLLCRSRRNWKNSTPSRNRRFIICGLRTISPTIDAIFGARK